MERALLWISANGFSMPSGGSDRRLAFAIQPLLSWFARADEEAWRDGLRDASVFARGELTSGLRGSILTHACPASRTCISLDAWSESHEWRLRVSRSGRIGWDWDHVQDWYSDAGVFHDIGVDGLTAEDELRIWGEWNRATQSSSTFYVDLAYASESCELFPAEKDGADVVLLFTPGDVVNPRLPELVSAATGTPYLTCDLSPMEFEKVVNGTFDGWGMI